MFEASTPVPSAWGCLIDCLVSGALLHRRRAIRPRLSQKIRNALCPGFVRLPALSERFSSIKAQEGPHCVRELAARALPAYRFARAPLLDTRQPRHRRHNIAAQRILAPAQRGVWPLRRATA